MSTDGVPIRDRMHRLIVERPDLASGKMFRSALGEKERLVVCDDWNVNAKWFEPLRVGVNVRSRDAERLHAKYERVAGSAEWTRLADQPADVRKSAKNIMIDTFGGSEILLGTLVSATEKDHVRTAMGIPVTTRPTLVRYRPIVVKEAFDIHLHRKLEKRTLPMVDR